MREWLTVTELSERTGVPDSTVRRYLAKFSDFFLPKGGTRSKRYEDTALNVILQIKELYDNGFETDLIHATLRNDFPEVIEEEPLEPISNALATTNDIQEIKQLLFMQQEISNRLLDRLNQQQEFIDRLLERDKLQTQQMINEAIKQHTECLQEQLTASVSDLNKSLDLLRVEHEETLWNKLISFFKHNKSHT